MAEQIAQDLRDAGFPDVDRRNRQVLALAEECGEFVAAFRRWSGQARRGGSAQEMRAELADVVITAFVTAHVLGVDMTQAINAKLNVHETRVLREPESALRQQLLEQQDKIDQLHDQLWAQADVEALDAALKLWKRGGESPQ